MTLTIAQNDAVVTNDATLRGAPAVRISADRVRFANRQGAVVESDAVGGLGIEIVGAGATVVNEAGATITGDRVQDPFAISGSAGADRIENAGTILGRVQLNDGADSLFNSGQLFGRVDLGAGDDLFVRIGQGAQQNGVAGGAGFDTYVLRGGTGFTNGSEISGFERLEIEGQGSDLTGYNGFSVVRVAAGASMTMFNSGNATGDLFLEAGSTARLLSDTVIRDVVGSGGAERLDLFSFARVEGSVDLGGGDDVLGFTGADFVPFVGGAVNGGAGRDVLELSVGGGSTVPTVDLSRFTGFEILNAGTFTSATTNVRLTGLNGFTAVDADNGGSLTIGGTSNAGLTVSAADNARLTIEAGSTIGQIDYLPNGFNFDRGTVTQARDAFSIVENNGRVAGDVRLTTGRDTYDGRLGTVGGTVFGYAGDDILLGGAGADRIDGGFGFDQIEGNDGDDLLFGGEGLDILTGGRGRDRLDGGAGIGMADYAKETGTGNVVVNLGAGSLFIDGVTTSSVGPGEAQDSFGDRDTLINLPDVSTGAGDDTVVGSAGANFITTGAGNDTIRGGGGDDYLRGREGSDRIDGEDGNDYIEGGDGVGDDRLDGGAGDDILVAGRKAAGADLVTGGPGRDILFVDFALSGTAVRTPATYAQGADGASGRIANDGGDRSVDFSSIDRLEINGSPFDDFLGGTENGDQLFGAAGNDTLAGNGGNDLLLGAEGDDRLEGGDGDDTLDGGAGNDVLFGGAGNDFFRLQAGGNDTAFGGAGDDAFVFGAALTAADRTFGGAGSDQVGLQGDYASGVTFGMDTLVDVETLVLLPGSDTRFGDTSGAFYSYNLTSADANVAAGTTLTVNMNTLRSGENVSFDGSAETDGAFFFYGGSGSDVLTGGAASDAFFFGTGKFGSGDRVTGNGGRDDQLGFQGDFTGANALVLGAGQVTGIETIVLLTGQDARFGGGGRAFSYDLTLNDGNAAAGATLTVNGNTLRPDETMRVDGSAETDARLTIFAGRGADVLIGGGGADSISGGAGDDRIEGGAGADFLTGNAGADVFIYASASDAGAGGGVDFITDFEKGDRIDLSRIDADRTSSNTNETFRFIGDAAFSGQAGELRVTPARGVSADFLVEADTNGDGIADMEFYVEAFDGMPLAASDFML